MQTAFCWLADAWFYQWFYHFNLKVNVVTMVTSAKRLYFYFRSKIWRHHRILRPRFPVRYRNFGDSGVNKVKLHIIHCACAKRPHFYFQSKIWRHHRPRSGQSRASNCISVPNFVKIGQTAAELCQFLHFSRWRPPPSWIFEISNFERSGRSKGSNCIIVPNFVEIAQIVAEIWLFFDFQVLAAVILDL